MSLHHRAGSALTKQTTDRVSLELHSALGSADTVEQTAEALAQQAGFDEDAVSQIALVCREAAVNAIVHGNRQDPALKVTVQFDLAEDTLSIRITDQGSGFDPDMIANPLAEENLLRTSGRGVFLMRAIMDEVQFRQLGQGTEVTLKKRRTTEGETQDMTNKIRHVDGITVFDLGGKITVTEGSGQLRSAIQDALSAGSKKILLNLGAVAYIDSSGLGELVGAYTTVKNAGGDLKLLNLTKKVKDLLVITKLLTVFDVSDDEKAAIASFA